MLQYSKKAFADLSLAEQMEIINSLPILTLQQASIYLQVAEITIKKWLRKGLIKSLTPPSHAVRLLKEDLHTIL